MHNSTRVGKSGQFHLGRVGSSPSMRWSSKGIAEGRGWEGGFWTTFASHRHPRKPFLVTLSKTWHGGQHDNLVSTP